MKQLNVKNVPEETHRFIASESKSISKTQAQFFEILVSLYKEIKQEDPTRIERYY